MLAGSVVSERILRIILINNESSLPRTQIHAFVCIGQKVSREEKESVLSCVRVEGDEPTCASGFRRPETLLARFIPDVHLKPGTSCPLGFGRVLGQLDLASVSS